MILDYLQTLDPAGRLWLGIRGFQGCAPIFDEALTFHPKASSKSVVCGFGRQK